jgi:hypothetical protein
LLLARPFNDAGTLHDFGAPFINLKTLGIEFKITYVDDAVRFGKDERRLLSGRRGRLLACTGGPTKKEISRNDRMQEVSERFFMRISPRSLDFVQTVVATVGAASEYLSQTEGERRKLGKKGGERKSIDFRFLFAYTPFR